MPRTSTNPEEWAKREEEWKYTWAPIKITGRETPRMLLQILIQLALVAYFFTIRSEEAHILSFWSPRLLCEQLKMELKLSSNTHNWCNCHIPLASCRVSRKVRKNECLVNECLVFLFTSAANLSAKPFHRFSIFHLTAVCPICACHSSTPGSCMIRLFSFSFLVISTWELLFSEYKVALLRLIDSSNPSL